MRPVNTLSINPASGYWENNFNNESFAIPESFSSGKDRFEQQTFLGASIRSFNINAGYGDSVSTLSVDLVNDEFNTSDGSGIGISDSDDVYHNGVLDRFAPPPVGSPVFFKFGTKKASVNESYKNLYDDIYNNNVAVNSYAKFHLCFGGILQSYVQNRGPGGNPLYSVQVVDPREILSNVTLILNNYSGTTFNNANMFNIYGFLEFNPSTALLNEIKSQLPFQDIFRKIVNEDGTYYFSGLDIRTSTNNLFSNFAINTQNINVNWENRIPTRFPITGTGFSRRGPQGIPYYRIRQAINALINIEGILPQEYLNAGFGGYINFRGHNYIVDLGGLKDLPNYYFFDFDQINLLDFCLEVCDITSSELFVSLLPIIDHPACSRFLQWNNSYGSDPKKLISGIIRIDSIDKSFQPAYGSIKNYIDRLEQSNIPIENRDVGFELSNVTTDKFIVGAQEVDMYFFSNNNDRGSTSLRKAIAEGDTLDNGEQWRLRTALKQQVLPYYGLLGNNAVTIPKGWGAYQQILLDSSSLNAKGVGNYYVATELELRSALISYERWSEFLLSYNDIYMESVEANDDIEGALLQQSPSRIPFDVVNISNNYAVTVPRSVFDTDNPSYGRDDLPISSCNPPFGYPLYYKRATKIGIQGAGLSDLYSRYNGILTSMAELNGAQNVTQLKTILNNIWDDFTSQSIGELTRFEIELRKRIERLKNDIENVTKADIIGLVQDFEAGLENSFKVMNRLAKETKENSLKVYNFVKSIAEECLGKKFLVRIHQNSNLFYDNIIRIGDNNKYDSGPFGFRPRSTNAKPGYEFSQEFFDQIEQVRSSQIINHNFESFFLDNPFTGALKLNFNPLTDLYEYNYTPEKQGGYVNFDLLSNIVQNIPIGVRHGLVPQDLNNFILDNSRISAYVRFDHSEHLSFNGVDTGSFFQQAIIANHYIPDLANQLDNVGTNADNFTTFSSSFENNPSIPSIAFVKCDVDDKFYMPPSSIYQFNNLYAVNIHGQLTKDIGKTSRPGKIFTCDIGPSGGWAQTRRYYKSNYVPIPTIGNSFGLPDDHFFVRDINTGMIKTKNIDLDPSCVYALITLPGRIVPTKDFRYRDSIFQTVNPSMLKHFLTMDVVKIPEFAIPNYVNNPPASIFVEDATFSQVAAATVAYNKALEKSINMSLHNRISVASPSPVYPDLVVLPLLSKERSYGPWVSSLIDSNSQSSIYKNIGGKIEFIKDENLAPWNFQGYDLMNEAGLTQARFSNSLLLQSERGGFVYAGAPSGIFIGKALANLGPLVTNISVDVSDNGIRTTIKMDLYTSSFGKLQKQKQDLISNISRERQKLKDERNGLIRKGIAKNQTNVNYNLIYQQIKNQSINSSYYTNYNLNSPSISHLVASVDIDNSYINSNKYNTSASVQSASQLSETASLLPDNINGANKYYNTASMSIGEFFAPYSLEPHPNMPYIDPKNRFNNNFYNT